MPKYVSDDGKWKPALEEVALTGKDGRPYIYKGEDRAALEDIAAGNVESRKWYEHPETINMIRQVHQMTVKEYMAMTGYDVNTTKAVVDKNLAEVNLHQDLPRKKASKHKSGGQNTAGGAGSREGDFGESAEAADAKARVK